MTRLRLLFCTSSLTIWAALSLSFFCSCLSAQELWGGTSYGMSPGAVAGAVKNARPPEQPSRLGSQAVELLRATDATFAGETFTAHFYFVANALVQVTLTRHLDSPFNFLAPELRKVEEEFTRKYGPHFSTLDNGDRVSPIVGKVWLFENRKMTTVLVAMGQKKTLLNVVYQAQPKP